jgi:hypothetical protein
MRFGLYAVLYAPCPRRYAIFYLRKEKNNENLGDQS